MSNQPALSHSWVSDGNYPVVLRAYNDTYSGGISATVIVYVVTVPIHYVSVTSTNPVTPYATWATAATNIQDAIDAAYAGQMVLVTNGLYQFGGAKAGRDPLTLNRAAVTKTLTVGSVNGPRFTTIQGSGSSAKFVRCVYLADGSVLFGFTLTNGFGFTPSEGCADFFGGGGVWCETTQATVSNCVIVGNTGFCAGGGAYSGTLIGCVLATNSSIQGAGAYGSILNNCLLLGNVGSYYSSGGGAYGGTLNNCTLIGNSAGLSGGGAYQSVLNNCIVYYNTAPSGTNYAGSTLTFCDTTPDPGGTGNITSPPLFVDQTNGNFRLQTNSPCINAGSNLYAPGLTDLDGRSRIVGGTVDIGAYEFQSAELSLFTAWLQQYGLPTDGSADFADSDGDGMNNWQEWRSGTNPTNSFSLLKMLPLASTNNAFGVQVSWQSVSGLIYYLQRASDLAGNPAFSTIGSNIIGQVGSTTFSDATATNSGPYFYRVAVQ